MKHSDVDVVFETSEIAAKVRSLGKELETSFAGEPLLLSLLSESMPFVADLVRAIEIPLRYELLKVDSTAKPGATEILDIQYPMPFEFHGADVLLLRDLSTSGVIESYLVPQLARHGASRVRVAALIDLPDRRTTEFSPDFRLFTLPGDVGTLVGYGLKHGGRFGNLPFIGQIKRANA